MHELQDGDLLEAMRGAEDHARGRLWALAAVVDGPTEPTANERGVVWLIGRDPNDDPITDVEHNTLRRMRDWRGRKVLSDGAL